MATEFLILYENIHVASTLRILLLSNVILKTYGNPIKGVCILDQMFTHSFEQGALAHTLGRVLQLDRNTVQRGPSTKQ